MAVRPTAGRPGGAPPPAVGLAELEQLFPVVFTVDEQLRIVDRSSALGARVPGAEPGRCLLDLLVCEAPDGIRSAEDVWARTGELYHWVAAAGGYALRGRFLRLTADTARLLFCGAPSIEGLHRHAPGRLAETLEADLGRFGAGSLGCAGEQRMIEELERVNRELKEASEASAAATRAKSSFLALISHEMRTPLNGVITGLNLLGDTPLEDDQNRLVEMVQESARTMLSVINSVLDFSRLEAGHLEIERTSFDLGDLVRTVVQVHALRAEARAVRLSAEIEPGAEGTWLGDDAKIRQILINLVSNAINFTTHGRVKLEVGPIDGGLRFEVEDTGAGIPDEDRERIFDAFFTRRSGAGAGTGLGLGFVRRLVSELGGTLDFTSRVGLGTRFWFTMPLERVGGPAPEADPSEPEQRRFRGRVLVAEDNPTNLLLARMMLDKFGVRSEGVSNGAEAVDMLSRLNFDLVLMDITMPILDGIAATRRVREVLGDGAPPVIALTAHAGSEDHERYLEAGMVDHLVKPVSARTLADALARHLEEVTAPGPARAAVAPAGDGAEAAATGIDPTVLGSLAEEIGVENVERVLLLFRGELRTRIDAIRQGATAGDWGAVASQCHTLRSSVASVGGRELADRLTRMEYAAREQGGVDAKDLDGLGELSVNTYTQLNETLRELEG